MPLIGQPFRSVGFQRGRKADIIPDMRRKGGNRQVLMAAVTLIGTIIGVGIFGIPYAVSQVGVGLALVYFLILGGIQLLQSLFYAEAIMACPEELRLVGLAGKFLGRRVRSIAAVAFVLGFWGASVAYILVGGIFLHLLLSPWLGGTPFHYQVIWGLVGSAVVYFGLGFIEKVDFWSTVALIVSLLAIVAAAGTRMELSNLTALVPRGDLFLPYGVILFSLSGLSAIPEMRDFMDGHRRGFRKAIVVGTLAATCLTALFGLAVYGVTGQGTTKDALDGLSPVLGSGIAAFGAAFGFLAVATSYFMIGLNLRSTFEYDYRLRRTLAWFLAAIVPLLAVVLGMKDFISTVSFTGAVFGGITAVIIAMLYVNVTRRGLLGKRRLGISGVWAYVSIVVLLLGAGYETVATLMRWP